MNHHPQAKTAALKALAGLGLNPVENLELARWTTLGIGGQADIGLELASVSLLGKVLDIAQDLGLPSIVLGGGSNSLFMDEGFPGLVIRLFRGQGKTELIDNILTVQTDVLLSRLVKTAVEAGVSGYEGLAGIPGTVGGALVNNAGAYGMNISDHLHSVTVACPQGKTRVLGKDDLLFGYRTSTFRRERTPIIQATFHFIPSEEPQKLYEKMREIQAVRRGKFLGIRGNAGSTFKNPPGDSAGRLLEQLGLKGHQVGQVCMSRTHANVMENLGGGKASDALHLLDEVEQIVFQKTGIQLERELEVHGQQTVSGFYSVTA